MPDSELLRLVVAHEDAGELLIDLQGGLENVRVTEVPDSLWREEEVRLGRSPIMHSETVRIVVLTLTGTGLVQGVARVLVERVRAKKRDVHILDQDGNEVILSGEFELSEITEILARAITNAADPSE